LSTDYIHPSIDNTPNRAELFYLSPLTLIRGKSDGTQAQALRAGQGCGTNGSLVWIGEVQSVRAAHKLIKLHAKQSSDEFSIRSRESLDLTHLRADENL